MMPKAKAFKHYRWTFGNLNARLKARQMNMQDAIVIITGDRGDGKSTLAAKILYGYGDFDPEEQVCYTKDKFNKLLKTKWGYALADEGVVNASRGNTQTKGNKILHELVTKNRDNCKIVIYCIPYIEDFDVKILQYCCMWIHVDRRGVAVVFLPGSKGVFGRKKWDVDYLKKLYEDYLKENKSKQRVPYWIFPNFRGWIRFGKLTTEQESEMLRIKTRDKNLNTDMEEGLIEEKSLSKVQKKREETQKFYDVLAEKLIKGEIVTRSEIILASNERGVTMPTLQKGVNNALALKGIAKRYGDYITY